MFEIVYSLFLLSGIIKSFWNAIFMLPQPVDMTLLLGLILVVLYIPRFIKDMMVRNKLYVAASSFPLLTTMSVFFAWMVITVVFTKSTGYCYEKLLLFLPNLIAFILPLLYIKFRPRWFLRFHVYAATGLSLLFAYYYPKILQFEIQLDEEGFAKGYLTIGYISGLTIAMLLFLDFGLKKPVRFALILLNAWVMMICGGRGPLFFLALVVLLKLMVKLSHVKKLSLRLSFKRIIVALTAVAVIVFGAYYVIDKYSVSLERSLFRFSQLLDAETDDSVTKRLSYIQFSFDKIFADVGNVLFGSGIGSFGIMYSGEDGRDYPHNILLEIWFELGLTGVALFILYISFYLKKVRFNSPLLYPFLYIVLNSLKSSSFTDLRIMFGFFSIFLLYDALMKRNNPQSDFGSTTNAS